MLERTRPITIRLVEHKHLLSFEFTILSAQKQKNLENPMKWSNAHFSKKKKNAATKENSEGLHRGRTSVCRASGDGFLYAFLRPISMRVGALNETKRVCEKKKIKDNRIRKPDEKIVHRVRPMRDPVTYAQAFAGARS